MDTSQQILSDITIFNKYAKHNPVLHRRETWLELSQRNMEMHIKKFPELKDRITDVYNNFVVTKKVLPSMRSVQFAGTPIEISNSRIFNCSYCPMDHPFAFAEILFALLSGCGVGFSVQHRHIDKLPVIVGPAKKQRRFLIGDSIEGWADSIKVLIKAYTKGKSDPDFDYRDIRPKGSRLITSGGKAPGPDPLRICIDQVRSVLNGAIGRKLTSLEVYDINCFLADAVLAGGIRRAAMICGFDVDDYDMLAAKTGDWWERNPQRGRCNNSVILHRKYTTKEHFDNIWNMTRLSGAGEPGFFWTNNYDMFCNPCCEIGLLPFQVCNLTEVNASNVVDQQDLNERAAAASFIGTLQASYTNFHYLRPIWKETSEKEALLGVSMTGIASGTVLPLDLEEAARVVCQTNDELSKQIGINPAARTTCIKPAGTSSAVLGSSSGIHAWHGEYYIRRIRVGKNEALYPYMVENFPMLIEDCKFKPHLEAVMSFPQKAPEGAILRDESAIDLLERVKRFNLEWIRPGHRSGDNFNNVSCTISVRENEWDTTGEWMWDNRNSYTGIAVLPYDGGAYVQSPFENITKEQYEEMYQHLHAIDITKVIEMEDITDLKESLACSGGGCEF